MVNLDEKEVKGLLRLVKNPRERKIIKDYLSQLKKIDSSGSMPARIGNVQRSTAMKALNIICRIGLEVGKHVLIDDFMKLID